MPRLALFLATLFVVTQASGVASDEAQFSPEQIEFRAETRKQLYTWQNACEQAAARFIDQ